MSEPALSSNSGDSVSLAVWLKTETTLRLPRWAFVAAGVVAFALFLVALD